VNDVRENVRCFYIIYAKPEVDMPSGNKWHNLARMWFIASDMYSTVCIKLN
jgi:hypothetical protein